jgi:hypothetical protein
LGARLPLGEPAGTEQLALHALQQLIVDAEFGVGPALDRQEWDRVTVVLLGDRPPRERVFDRMFEPESSGGDSERHVRPTVASKCDHEGPDRLSHRSEGFAKEPVGDHAALVFLV